MQVYSLVFYIECYIIIPFLSFCPENPHTCCCIYIHAHIESLEKEKVLSPFVPRSCGATAVNFWSFSFQNKEENLKILHIYFWLSCEGAYSPLVSFSYTISLEIGEKSLKFLNNYCPDCFWPFIQWKEREREKLWRGNLLKMGRLYTSIWKSLTHIFFKKEVDSSCCRVRWKWRPEHFLFNLRPSARVLDDGGKTEPLSFSLRVRRIIKHFPKVLFIFDSFQK